MTRKQYMSKLQNRLCFLLPESEVSDILTDMEECFEAGIADGKTEEQIAENLGDPKTAAKEILAERKEPVKFTKSLFFGKYLPSAVCILMAAAYFLLLSIDIWRGIYVPFMLAGIALVPAMWAITEKKKFLSTLLTGRTDFLTLAGAALTYIPAVLLHRVLYAVARAEEYDVMMYYGFALTLLITAANVMLILSILKSAKPDFLCVMPAAAIGFSCFALVRTSRVMHIISLDKYIQTNENYYSGTLPERYYHDLANYLAGIGKTLDIYIHLVIISLFVFMTWTLINRSAFSIPVLYLALLGGEYEFFVHDALRAVDPAEPSSMAALQFEKFASAGATAAAVSFVIIIIARIAYKKKTVPAEAKDGDC